MSYYEHRRKGTFKIPPPLVENCFISPFHHGQNSWEITVDIYGGVSIDYDCGHIQLDGASKKDFIKIAKMFREAAQKLEELQGPIA